MPFADRLDTVTLPVDAPGPGETTLLVELVEAVNAHAEKLNARLFTYLDYAVVATR